MVNKQNISYHTDKILDKRYHINGANDHAMDQSREKKGGY